ncbi:Macrophage receptor MARCO [Orchesella cincta]|uniref:Macrophage receptor MARCO n=1 Tax=Orchesella cincta TaxID=48709 RepID=A0A1D2N6E1_ORCCI|nr:Macrophage receptor MARCO [Orchesella cincta]
MKSQSEKCDLRNEGNCCSLQISENFASTVNPRIVSVHELWKRQTRSIGSCPPGCIRRKRRRLGFTGSRPVTAISSQNGNGYRRENGHHTKQSDTERATELDRAELGRSAGETGLPGDVGLPGAPGYAGMPGAPGYAGMPGSPGDVGMPGAPGSSGMPGAPGYPGIRGTQGRAGLPGGRGNMGAQGLQGPPGERGYSGSQGRAGSSGEPGLQGPSGESGQTGYSYNHHEEYNNHLVKSRGDQGNPLEDPAAYEVSTRKPRNDTQIPEFLRLLDHPECKDEVDHKALMQDLKNRGKVSFMILVDLDESVYCIVHA